jgi:hypothetical protein
MNRIVFRWMLWALVVLAALRSEAVAETVARCGQGWLERINGYPVLHVKGSPYERGYQQGALLKESIRQNVHNLLVVRGDKPLAVGPVSFRPRMAIEIIAGYQQPYVPQKFYDEMAGVAEGADVPVKDIVAANFIPEMFHCSGFAVMNSATADGTLYHGRVLDYSVDWQLQEHAVIVVSEPDDGIAFVNVTFAGFIGSVTGMNAQSVSIGEMGGGGLGHWSGVPMALLVREALEKGSDLDAAIAVFRDNKRTCQYFYVVADGKTNRAVGMEASWNTFTLVEPGASHPRLPKPVKDAVLLSAGDRYEELVRRAKAGHGKFDATAARELMACPVATGGNLHNVLFEPRSTRFWVANASIDQKPAADQPYHAFQLTELLSRQPDPAAKEIALKPREAGTK